MSKTYKVEVDLAVHDDGLALLDKEPDAARPEKFLLQRNIHISIKEGACLAKKKDKSVDKN